MTSSLPRIARIVRQQSVPDYALAPQVLYVPAPDGTARLLDLRGHFFAVSAIGSEMIQAALQHGLPMAITKLAARYGVLPEIVEADLEDLLAQLRRQHLLRYKGEISRRGNLVAADTVLWPLLQAIRMAPWSLSRKAMILLTLARISFNMFGFARTIGAWQRTFSPVSHRQAADAESAIASMHQSICRAASRHCFQVGCKERSLCCWTLLSWAGIPSVLTVGVEFYPFAGHCWCASGSQIVGDDPDRCKQYQPIVTYGSTTTSEKFEGSQP
jgi:hypothetical protein